MLGIFRTTLILFGPWGRSLIRKSCLRALLVHFFKRRTSSVMQIKSNQVWGSYGARNLHVLVFSGRIYTLVATARVTLLCLLWGELIHVILRQVYYCIIFSAVPVPSHLFSWPRCAFSSYFHLVRDRNMFPLSYLLWDRPSTVLGFNLYRTSWAVC